MQWARRSISWTSFSSPWVRARDSNRDVDLAVGRPIVPAHTGRGCRAESRTPGGDAPRLPPPRLRADLLESSSPGCETSSKRHMLSVSTSHVLKLLLQRLFSAVTGPLSRWKENGHVADADHRCSSRDCSFNACCARYGRC